MDNPYKKEMADIVKQLGRGGVGILAADESVQTLGKKFEPLKIPNEVENRRRYREMLFTTENYEKYISGIILFDETVYQADKNGKKFLDIIKSKGVIPGVKTDKGLQPFTFSKGESWTAGLDDLDKRCKQYYQLGCRFTKWRNIFNINEKDKLPTEQAIWYNAQTLAFQAAISQACGLAPMVEPEVLMDGPHSIDVCQRVTEQVLHYVIRALFNFNVYLEGCGLKTSMVVPGNQNPDKDKITPQEIGIRSVNALSHTVPPSIQAIFFLSGGQSEEEASINLNAINQAKSPSTPWVLSFSYGRALQNSAVRIWAGKDENVKEAQKAFFTRAKANGEATLGQYKISGA